MRRAFTFLVALLILPVTTAAQQDTAAPNERIQAWVRRYHPLPRDTLGPEAYSGWQQYSLYCARCHGQGAEGTSFGPDLVKALAPDGAVPTRDAFVALLATGRPDRGMPAAATLGLSTDRFDAVYRYLHGRATGAFTGGRPARRGS